jgi:phospholipase/carboxylesterase
MNSGVIVQKPVGTIDQLVLFFHGVGSDAQDLVPVAQQFARILKRALVVSLNGAQPSDFGSGRQWFSVAGVTEENRAARVATVMQLFQSMVQRWQEASGMGVDKTILVGFSQGSIMALESHHIIVRGDGCTPCRFGASSSYWYVGFGMDAMARCVSIRDVPVISRPPT